MADSNPEATSESTKTEQGGGARKSRQKSASAEPERRSERISKLRSQSLSRSPSVSSTTSAANLRNHPRSSPKPGLLRGSSAISKGKGKGKKKLDAIAEDEEGYETVDQQYPSNPESEEDEDKGEQDPVAGEGSQTREGGGSAEGGSTGGSTNPENTQQGSYGGSQKPPRKKIRLEQASASIYASQMQQLQLSLHERQRNFEERAFAAFDTERQERSAQHEAMMKAIKDAFSSPLPAAIGGGAASKKKRSDYLTDLKDELKENPNKSRFRRYLRHYVRNILLDLASPEDVDEDEDEGEDDDEEDGEEGREGERKEMDGVGNKNEQPLGELLQGKFPPLTAKEWKNYQKKSSDAPIITVKDFRFDFSKALSHEFNQDALYVASAGFKDKLKTNAYGNGHKNGPLGKGFLELSYIEACMRDHFKHLQRTYKEAGEENAEQVREARLRNQAVRTRKTTLYQHRIHVVEVDPEFMVHKNLVTLAGKNSMSDEESDVEVFDGEERECLRMVMPAWRSEAFEALYQEVDGRYKEMTRTVLGKRRKPAGSSARPRTRKQRKVTEDLPPPAGLWRNCFSEDWLNRKRAWELSMLKVVDSDYDFEVHKRDAGVSA